MTLNYKVPLCVVSSAALLVLSSSAAVAFTFTPIPPALCPNFTEVDFSYSVSSTEWEQDTDFQGHYLNHTDHYRYLIANGYVDKFGVRLDYMELEAEFDKLRYSSSGTSQYSTGIGPLGWKDLSEPSQSFQGGGSWPYINFSTDESATFGGFRFGKARTCANDLNLATSPLRNVNPGTRTMGVLLGTDDVVYLQVPVGAGTGSCSSLHHTFALWGQIGAGNDFDMFARCNALPTPTAFTYSARSGDNQEFIHTNPADCPCGGTWNIAIHSFRGSGQFNFVPSKHTKHYDKHTVAIMCDLNAADFATRVSRTREGFKTWYGVTEGGWFFNEVIVKDKASLIPWQSTRWECSNGRAHSPVCNAANPFFLYNQETQPHGGKVFAHEMGHYYGCVRDEYEDGKNHRCGHSFMANQGLFSNMCYCWNWGSGSPDSSNGCKNGWGDHNRDADPLWGSPPPASSHLPVWKKWYDDSVIPFPVTATPDTFDYVPFDFNGLYPIITEFNN